MTDFHTTLTERLADAGMAERERGYGHATADEVVAFFLDTPEIKNLRTALSEMAWWLESDRGGTAEGHLRAFGATEAEVEWVMEVTP